MSKQGKMCVGIGLLLLAAALFLTVYNFWSDAMASVSSNTALEYLKPDNKEHTGVNLPVLPSGETLEEAYFPDYILNPEMDMPEKEVGTTKTILDMVLNDLMENERSIVSFMDSASYGITDILDAISSAIMKEIEHGE